MAAAWLADMISDGRFERTPFILRAGALTYRLTNLLIHAPCLGTFCNLRAASEDSSTTQLVSWHHWRSSIVGQNTVREFLDIQCPWRSGRDQPVSLIEDSGKFVVGFWSVSPSHSEVHIGYQGPTAAAGITVNPAEVICKSPDPRFKFEDTDGDSDDGDEVGDPGESTGKETEGIHQMYLTQPYTRNAVLENPYDRFRMNQEIYTTIILPREFPPICKRGCETRRVLTYPCKPQTILHRPLEDFNMVVRQYKPL